MLRPADFWDRPLTKETLKQFVWLFFSEVNHTGCFEKTFRLFSTAIRLRSNKTISSLTSKGERIPLAVN